MFQSNKKINFCISVLHTEHFPEFHVDWHSINDVVLYSEYRHSKLMRSVTSKLGFAKSKYFKNIFLVIIKIYLIIIN